MQSVATADKLPVHSYAAPRRQSAARIAASLKSRLQRLPHPQKVTLPKDRLLLIALLVASWTLLGFGLWQHWQSARLSPSDTIAQSHELPHLAAGVFLFLVTVLSGLMLPRRQNPLPAPATPVSLPGIATIRTPDRVPAFDRRAAELLGLPASLLARRPTLRAIIEWQHANEEFGDAATYEQVLRQADAANSVYERTRPNGAVLEIRTETQPGGTVTRTYTDVTERKREEAAAAAARLQAMGQLAAGIVHDFNNILAAVQGSASLLAHRPGDAAATERSARIIMDATQRGTAITHRLLAFARQEPSRPEPTDPATVLETLREIAAHTLGHRIAVRVSIAPNLPPILADRRQLETALVNLAVNARDAMPDGGTLTFAATLEQPSRQLRQYMRLSVIDTGTGMDQTVAKRALEPFFTTKPAGQGTGLGLPMARDFAEHGGGGLSIASVPGQGTSVTLRLPVAEPAAIMNAKQVLLVEDEPIVSKTLAAVLEDAGFTVLTAADGPEALTLLRSGAAVDALVTDLSMPGMDGLAVIRQARASRPGLPAVLLTAYPDYNAHLAIQGAMSGTYSLLQKPIGAVQLVGRIQALLAETSPADPGR